MRRALISTLALALLGFGCKGGSAPGAGAKPTKQTKSAEPEPTATEPESGESVLLEAAGLRLQLPATWTVLASDDPNFGFAIGPSEQTTQVLGCTIELRRQGAGELIAAAKPTADSKPDDQPYRHGKRRGRLRSFAGPTPASARVVHCYGPRQNKDWAALDKALDKLEPHAEAELAAPVPAAEGESLVEVCTATPARKTQVCVRSAAGAVYCGASEGATLTKVSELPPVTALGCDGLFTCARAETGAMWCWEPDEPAQEVAGPGPIRDIAGACIATEAGTLLCRARDEAPATLGGFVELLPFGEAEHTQKGVEQVLAGTNAERGCVIAEGALRCWDRIDSLPLKLDAAEGRAPQIVETLTEPETVTDLVLRGQRVCIDRGGQLTCIADGQRYALDDCSVRACGCSLMGLAKLSCEDTLDTQVGARLYGRVGGIRAADGACGLRADDRVVCRGPITGELEDRPELTKLVTGPSPGVLHLFSIE